MPFGFRHFFVLHLVTRRVFIRTSRGYKYNFEFYFIDQTNQFFSDDSRVSIDKSIQSSLNIFHNFNGKLFISIFCNERMSECLSQSYSILRLFLEYFKNKILSFISNINPTRESDFISSLELWRKLRFCWDPIQYILWKGLFRWDINKSSFQYPRYRFSSHIKFP